MGRRDIPTSSVDCYVSVFSARERVPQNGLTITVPARPTENTYLCVRRVFWRDTDMLTACLLLLTFPSPSAEFAVGGIMHEPAQTTTS